MEMLVSTASPNEAPANGASEFCGLSVARSFQFSPQLRQLKESQLNTQPIVAMSSSCLVFHKKAMCLLFPLIASVPHF